MKPHYTDIEAFLRNNFDCTIFKGDWGDPFPDDIYMACQYNNVDKVDWVFSWLSPWKLPNWVLKYAKKGAINFHPGPPKYPGIGCYNYAIWNEDKEYGVTAHLMDEKLDHGKIIHCYRFPMYGNETIETLKNRAIVALKNLFYDLMELILDPEEVIIVDAHEEWGEYKSKKDFEACCRVEIQSGIFYGLGLFDPNNYEERFEKFLRAFYYHRASEGPFIEIKGKKWRLIPV